MLLPLLSLLGWLLAHTPEVLLRALTVVLGEALLWLAPRRRRLVLSNLHHAYPSRSAAWRAGIARTGSQQLIETGLLSLATPFFSERRIRRLGRYSPELAAWARTRMENPRAVVFATLHVALWESQTWLKLLSPVPLPEFGAIFRPLDSGAADTYLKRSRERFGMRLLSRKDGFAQALKILRGKGFIGLLFDQNAGLQGNLTTLFGRVCSTTELPGLLAAKFGAELRTIYPRRTGFWRLEFVSEAVAHDGTPVGMTLALNQWLEHALEDERLCAAWLWAHNRWRHQDTPERRFRLESRRDLLPADRRARGWAVLPRKTRIWVRMPNWLGDVMIALPLLRALREGRPDAEVTLIARPVFLPLLRGWEVADRMLPLPPRGLGYFGAFWRWRREYPDVALLFTQSWRSDLEAWLTGAPQRFGLVRPGRWRPLLTQVYPVPSDFDEASRHQLELWENFFRHFGLEVPLRRTPWLLPGAPAAGAIGLIAGSENLPAKRWPVEHWRALIAALPDERFILFGTARDRPITAAIAAGSTAQRVENLAGLTDLAGLRDRLRECRLLITNDTGGMHLASAIGVPLIALFGPTNPLRTGPVYAGPHQILQPADTPLSGGGRLADLPPARVLAALQDFLRRGSSGD